MADDVERVEERDAYDEFVDALEQDEAAKAERVQAKQAKVDALSKEEFRQYVAEEKVEKLQADFQASASDDAKNLFAVYSHGVDLADPAAVKRLMDLAVTNSKAAEPKVDEEEVERLADEKAKAEYGAGPLAAGQPPEKPDQDAEDIKRISQGGPEMNRVLAESIFREDPVLGQFYQR